MPIHEIRRRFMIEGDELTVVYDDRGPVYMGLPAKPANVLIELAKQGKIGLECCADYNTRVLMGVFPMHPAREEGTFRPLGFAPRPPNGHAHAPPRREAPHGPGHGPPRRPPLPNGGRPPQPAAPAHLGASLPPAPLGRHPLTPSMPVAPPSPNGNYPAPDEASD
jgi:hypothetical protein